MSPSRCEIVHYALAAFHGGSFFRKLLHLSGRKKSDTKAHKRGYKQAAEPFPVFGICRYRGDCSIQKETSGAAGFDVECGSREVRARKNQGEARAGRLAFAHGALLRREGNSIFKARAAHSSARDGEARFSFLSSITFHILFSSFSPNQWSKQSSASHIFLFVCSNLKDSLH